MTGYAVEVKFPDKIRTFNLKAVEGGHLEGFVFRMKFRFEWVSGIQDDEGRDISAGYWEAYHVKDSIRCWGTGGDLIEVIKDICRTRGLLEKEEQVPYRGPGVPRGREIHEQGRAYFTKAEWEAIVHAAGGEDRVSEWLYAKAIAALNEERYGNKSR